MARSGFPSLTALLGLLAVAGYQNRDKIGDWMNSQRAAAPGGSGSPGGLGGLLGGSGGGGLGGLLSGITGGGGFGGLVNGGLSDLDRTMRQNGRSSTMDSWVGHGPNQSIEPHDLQAALGPEVLEDLEEHTGLTRDEILRRLSATLPEAVNHSTPDGRLPA